MAINQLATCPHADQAAEKRGHYFAFCDFRVESSFGMLVSTGDREGVAPRLGAGGRSSYCGDAQRSHADQVVRGRCHREHPSNLRPASMTDLTQQGHALDPAENLFDPFALPLAYHEPAVPGGARVDVTRTPAVRTHMRRH